MRALGLDNGPRDRRRTDRDLAVAHACVLVGQQSGDAAEDALPGGVELVAGDLVYDGASRLAVIR